MSTVAGCGITSLLNNWNIVHMDEMTHRHAVTDNSLAENQCTKPCLSNIKIITLLPFLPLRINISLEGLLETISVVS